jgi:outer membrane protein assembly factor BamC
MKMFGISRKALRFGLRASLRRLFLGSSLALLAGGCAVVDVVEDKGRIDYRSATQRPSLDVPPDLVSPRRDERFAVQSSAAADRTLSSFERERGARQTASASGVLPALPGVRIERSGERRWLRVDAPAERVFPMTRDFWVDSGFRLTLDSPETGILETDWAENRAKIPDDFIRRALGRLIDGLYSTGERDRFRTRLERVDGGTEIYISHRGMVEVYTTQSRESTSWQPRPADPELEVEFLNRLMLRLGGDQAKTAQRVAAASAMPERARLVGEGDSRAIEVDEGFDRAWRQVGLALDRGGFTVEDRDRSRGQYFVRYIDVDVAPGKEPGFFSRVFGGSKAPRLSQQYRVNVAAGNSNSRITVLDKDGKPVGEADRETVTRILNLLRQQLNQS